MTDRHREIAKKIIPEPFINAQEEIAKALAKLEAETLERCAVTVLQDHHCDYTSHRLQEALAKAIRSLNDTQEEGL